MRIEIETDTRCAEEIAHALSKRLDELTDVYEGLLEKARTSDYYEKEADEMEALMKSLEKAKDSVYDQVCKEEGL